MDRVKSPHLKLVRSQAVEDMAGHLAPAGREAVQAAMALAETWYEDGRLASGEPALGHALGTAALVSGLKLDADAIVAALLVPVVEVSAQPIVVSARSAVSFDNATVAAQALRLIV